MGSTYVNIISWWWNYFNFYIEFFQIRYFPYIMKETFGKMFSKPAEGEGTITPFQAACSALASTVGAANIIGVPVAIAFGVLVLFSGCG